MVVQILDKHWSFPAVMRCWRCNRLTKSLTLFISGVWTKCQPDKMPTGQNANLGWHFVRDFFSMVGILSGPTFWLAFCPDHLNMSWHPLPTSESGGGPCNIFLFAVDCCGGEVDV